MKYLFLVTTILLFILSCGTFKKKVKDKSLRLVTYRDTFYQKDSIKVLEADTFDLGICYYKNYVAYLEYIYLYANDRNKPFDPQEIEFLPNGVKFNFYILEKGSDVVLKYEKLDAETFSILTRDSVEKKLGIDSVNLLVHNLDLGKPNKVVRNTKTRLIESEHFYDNKISEDDTDTISRFYDRNMNGIDFSFSKSLDKQHKSKLVKTRFVTLPRKVKQKDGTVKTTAYIEDTSVIYQTEIKDKNLYIALFERFGRDIKNVKQ